MGPLAQTEADTRKSIENPNSKLFREFIDNENKRN